MIRHILLAGIAAAMIAVLSLSKLPWSVTDRPVIEDIGPLRTGVDYFRLEGLLGYTGVVLPRPEAAPRGNGVMRFGYSYREFVLLRMPFFASRELGLVVYRDLPTGYQLMPLEGDHAQDLFDQTRVKAPVDYRFAWWRHIWGWGFFVALGIWYWLQRRADERRRDAAGII